MSTEFAREKWSVSQRYHQVVAKQALWFRAEREMSFENTATHNAAIKHWGPTINKQTDELSAVQPTLRMPKL